MSEIILPEVVSEDFTPRWDETLSNEQYHADKSALSSSALKKILKSPRTFWSYLSGEEERKETQSMKMGTLFHMALLEPQEFKKRYVIEPKFSGKTKDGKDSSRSSEAKTAREEWRASLDPSAVILKEEEKKDIIGMINSVVKHKDALRVLRSGKAEISGYFRDPGTGLKCRIRPDFFYEKDMTLMDVKTTEDCSRDPFSKSLWTYRYDVQVAMYCEGIRMITGKAVKNATFLVVEKKPPYECAMYRCDESMIDFGLVQYQNCLDTLKRCIESNQWNSYQNQIEDIGLPRWATSIFE